MATLYRPIGASTSLPTNIGVISPSDEGLQEYFDLRKTTLKKQSSAEMLGAPQHPGTSATLAKRHLVARSHPKQLGD